MFAAIAILNIALMLVMRIHVDYTNLVNAEVKKAFRFAFSLITIETLFDFMAVTAERIDYLPISLHIAIVFFELLLAPALISMWLFLSPSKKLKHLIWCVLIANALLQLYNLFSGCVFYVDAQNQYFRGEYYCLYVLLYSIGVILMLLEATEVSQKYQNRALRTLFGSSIFMLAGIIFNIYSRDINSTWIGIGICAVMYYIYYIELITQVDALTGLLNRHNYEYCVEHLNYPTAIIFFDVNNFKDCNDMYGHNFGDTALQIVASHILQTFHAVGHSYRIGGDEFCVIFKKHQLEKHGPVDSYLESFHEALAKDQAQDARLPSVSIGYTLYNGSSPIQQVLKEADHKMYQSKRQQK